MEKNKIIQKKITKYRHISTGNHDDKIWKEIITKLYEHVLSMGISKDNGSIDDEYKKILYSIKALHVYLYDQKNSNLSLNDAKIFVSYLLEKIKSLKNIIDKFD